MSKSQTAHDLGRDLQHSVGEVIDRKMKIAQHALDPAELTIMLIEASVALILTTAATAAATVDDPSKVEEFFDFTIDSIANLARADRERSLAKVRARRAEVGA